MSIDNLSKFSNCELVIHRKVATNIHMFRAIGFVIVLWYLSSVFAQSFHSADKAISASFKTLEATAIVSQQKIEQH